VVPFALLGKRTRMVSVLTFCALLWGIAATCFAGVQNYSGAFACRFFIGLGGTMVVCYFPLALLTHHQRLAFPHSFRSSCQGSTQERSWVLASLFGWQWLRSGKSRLLPSRESMSNNSQRLRQRHRRLRCLLHPRQTRIVANPVHDRRRRYCTDRYHRDHRAPR
jgi:hypothetical protein